MIDLIVIVIAVVLVIIFSKSKNKNQTTQTGQSNQSYDRGYWAGRRDLRQELLELISGKSSVDKEDIKACIDKNQWYEDDYEASSINTDEVHSLAQQSTSGSFAAVSDSLNQKKTQKPVDYSIGLLYLGAFLFIAAASLFVLLGGVGGAVKTSVVIGVSAGFYTIGYLLNKNSKKLVEVGSTFAAIGLMLAPLSGVAVYGYWLNQSHGTAVWLGASIACTLLYTHALFKLRSQYMGYLFVGVTISLVESGFSQFGLGSYFMAWGLMLASLISLVLSKSLKNHQINSIVELPFTIAAVILVPVSLVWSLTLIPIHGTVQLIISLYFAAIYYAVYGWTLGSGSSRQTYWFISQVAAISSTGILLHELTASRFVVSSFFAISTILYLAVTFVKYLNQMIPRHLEGFIAMSAGLYLAAIVGFASLPNWLFGVLYVGFVMFWFQWFQAKTFYSAVIAQMTLLTLPAVLGWYVLKDGIGNIWISLVYMLIAISCSIIAYWATKKHKQIKLLFIASYIIASTIGLIVSFVAGGYAVAIASLLIAGLAYLASVQHKRPEISTVGNALLYVATLASITEAKLSLLYTGIAFMVLSVCIYCLSFIIKNKLKSKLFRYSAMVGLLTVPITGLIGGSYWYLGPISISVLAAIVFYESTFKDEYGLKELSASFLMLALQWIIFRVFYTNEFLIYSHLWALLIIAFSLVRLKRNEKSLFESYLKLGLGVITIPFALILINGTDLGYGWVFIAEHIMITFFGVVFKKAYVVWWGLLATVLAVLYELRDLQFIALGILSLFVIGVAIYMTLNHQKSAE